MGLPRLFVGMKRDSPGHQTLVRIPTLDVLHIKGFAQGCGQFLPMRHLMPGAVPIAQLSFPEGHEQQGRVVIEHLGNGFDVDVQMHHWRGLGVECQEVFTFQKVGTGRAEELSYQRMGQRFKLGRHGHEFTVEQ